MEYIHAYRHTRAHTHKIYSVHVMRKCDISYISSFCKMCAFPVIATGRNYSCLSNWQGYFVYADGDLVTTDA